MENQQEDHGTPMDVMLQTFSKCQKRPGKNIGESGPALPLCKCPSEALEACECQRNEIMCGLYMFIIITTDKPH